MLKFCPPPTKNKPGFTLVELLVVIAILAVLAIIGFAAFRGISSRANDAKRRGDIDAIAKALEVNNSSHKPCENGSFLQGSYCSIVDSWFSGGMPQDPASPSRYYCYASDSVPGTIPAGVPSPTAVWSNACPIGWNPLGLGAPPQPNAYFWKICAWLENNTTFCRNNLQ